MAKCFPLLGSHPMAYLLVILNFKLILSAAICYICLRDSNYYRITISQSTYNNKSNQELIKDMATLQRSTAFRRQGSSGVVWEDKYFLKEDKVDYKELRPCQSARVVLSMTDPGQSKAEPSAFPRSYSTAPVNHSFGKPLAIPKSKSDKRKLFSNLLFSSK